MTGNNKAKKIEPKANTFKDIFENFWKLVEHADLFLKFVVALNSARVCRY